VPALLASSPVVIIGRSRRLTWHALVDQIRPLQLAACSEEGNHDFPENRLEERVPVELRSASDLPVLLVELNDCLRRFQESSERVELRAHRFNCAFN
jgi:hypothetical protein